MRFSPGHCKKNCQCVGCSGAGTPLYWTANILGTDYILYRGREVLGIPLSPDVCFWQKYVDETIDCAPATVIRLFMITPGVGMKGFWLEVRQAISNQLLRRWAVSIPAPAGTVDCTAPRVLSDDTPALAPCAGTDVATITPSIKTSCCSCGSSVVLPCEACDGFEVAEQYMVSVGGTPIWTNDSCTSCNLVQEDYILSRPAPDTLPCLWQYTQGLCTDIHCGEDPVPWSLRIELQLNGATGGPGAGVYIVTFTIAPEFENYHNSSYFCYGRPGFCARFCAARYKGHDIASPTECRGPVTIPQVTSGSGGVCVNPFDQTTGDFVFNRCSVTFALGWACNHAGSPTPYNPVSSVTVTAVP